MENMEFTEKIKREISPGTCARGRCVFSVRSVVKLFGKLIQLVIPCNYTSTTFCSPLISSPMMKVRMGMRSWISVA